MSGKQPRKPAKSFSEFASSFADELGSLASAARKGPKTSYANTADIDAASIAREKERKKRKPAY